MEFVVHVVERNAQFFALKKLAKTMWASAFSWPGIAKSHFLE
jgi:hypothetical protein